MLLFILSVFFIVTVLVISAVAAFQLIMHSYELSFCYTKSENLEFIEDAFLRTLRENREHFFTLRLERESGSQWGEVPFPLLDPFRLERKGEWREFRPEVGAMDVARYFEIENTLFEDAKTRMTSFGQVKDRQDELELVEGAHGPELVFKGDFDEEVADVITIITGPLSEEDPAHIVWTWHPGRVAPRFDETQLTVTENGRFEAPDEFPVKLAKKKSSEMRGKK